MCAIQFRNTQTRTQHTHAEDPTGRGSFDVFSVLKFTKEKKKVLAAAGNRDTQRDEILL